MASTAQDNIKISIQCNCEENLWTMGQVHGNNVTLICLTQCLQKNWLCVCFHIFQGVDKTAHNENRNR